MLHDQEADQGQRWGASSEEASSKHSGFDEAVIAPSQWGRIALVYLGGVCASLCLGKIAPAAPLLAADLGFTLTQIGWLVSLIAAVAAVMGLPAGFWTRRLGARRSTILGLMILAVAGGIVCVAWDPRLLFIARIIEGVGFVLVVVAGPSLLLRLAHGRDQAAALALWGTFVPVGLAIGAAFGGVVATDLGWRAWMAIAAAACLGMALLMARMISNSAVSSLRVTTPFKVTGFGPSFLLAAGFCGLSLIGVAILGLFPTYLVTERATGIAAAGAATGLVSLLSVPGSLLAGWLMRRGLTLKHLSVSIMLFPAAAVAIFVFSSSLVGDIVGAGVLLLANGIVVAGVFAAVPRLVGTTDQIDIANGLVAQLGSLGSLAGPPLITATVAVGGWRSVPLVILLLSAIGIVLILMAELRRSFAHNAG